MNIRLRAGDVLRVGNERYAVSDPGTTLLLRRLSDGRYLHVTEALAEAFPLEVLCEAVSRAAVGRDADVLEPERPGGPGTHASNVIDFAQRSGVMTRSIPGPAWKR